MAERPLLLILHFGSFGSLFALVSAALHRLGRAAQLSEVEQRMANCQQEMANEFDGFTERLSDFINWEIHQFGQRLTLLEGTSQTSQDIGTQAREVS